MTGAIKLAWLSGWLARASETPAVTCAEERANMRPGRADSTFVNMQEFFGCTCAPPTDVQYVSPPNSCAHVYSCAAFGSPARLDSGTTLCETFQVNFMRIDRSPVCTRRFVFVSFNSATRFIRIIGAGGTQSFANQPESAIPFRLEIFFSDRIQCSQPAITSGRSPSPA